MSSGAEQHRSAYTIGAAHSMWSLGMSEVWRYRALLTHSIRREVMARYRTAALGHIRRAVICVASVPE